MGIKGIPPDVVLPKVLYARALPFFTFDFMISESVTGGKIPLTRWRRKAPFNYLSNPNL
jgi:hypothetical protein